MIPLRNLFAFSLFLLLFTCTGLSAQVSQFRNYSIKDGLPSSEVYHAMQDSKGYLWFATDKGVSRFDGYTFKTFTTANGLADNTIFECMEDYKGRIWFRSFSGRLSYFYNDSLIQLTGNDSLVHALQNKRITSLSVDGSDILSIGVYGLSSIIQIHLRNKCAISFLPLPAARGILYIGRNGSKNLINGDNHGRADYGTLSEAATPGIHFLNLQKPGGDPVIVPFASTPAPENNMYHTNLRNKAVLLSKGTIASSVDVRLTLFNEAKAVYKQTFGDIILNLCPDNEDGMWIAFLNKAPLYYRDGKITAYTQLGMLKDKQITAVAKDREGGLWFTSLNDGVYYLRSLSAMTWTKETGLPGNKVTAVNINQSDGAVWVSMANTHTLSRIFKDSVTNYPIGNLEPATLMTGVLFNIGKSNWVSSNMKIFSYENNDKFKLLAERDKGAVLLLKNKDETAWAVYGDNKFDLLRQGAHSIEQVKRIELPVKIFAACRENDNKVWLGTMNGLWEYENDSLVYWGNKFPFLKKRISDIRLSSAKDLWIATRDTGLIVISGNKEIRLTSRDGLPGNFCNRLFIDYKDNIWVGSSRGLSHILVHKGSRGLVIDTIQTINTFNFSEINCITGSGDKIYVGTSSGLTCFDMNDTLANRIPPPVYITSIRVNNKDAAIGSVLPELRYDENYLVIKYVGLSYRDAGNTGYRYKMEGIDTGWVYTKFTTAQYPKLPPGNYVFLVSAMNNDGIWNRQAAAFRFAIAPPWWATWWARSLALLGISGLVYWRVMTIKTREMRKTEVNRQLTEMELKELKAQFDPHFLFNSLNILSHLAEDKPQTAPEYIDELSKYYRYSLKHNNRQFVEMETEAEQAERYLSLLKLRFGEGLQVKWDIDPAHEQSYILCSSLQLLIENITKHNVVTDERPLLIEISSTKKNLLSIQNPLQPKNSQPASTGHGLKSIALRYRLLTGKEIHIIQTDSFFRVELPLLNEEDHENINY